MDDEVALIQAKVAHLEAERQRAAKTRNTGLTLIALVPIDFLIVLVLQLLFAGHAIVGILFVAACIYGTIGGILGVVMTLVGTAQRRIAGERLAELAEQRRLPEARVVVR